MCSATACFFLRPSFFVAPSLRLRFLVLSRGVGCSFLWAVESVVYSGWVDEEAIVFVNGTRVYLPWFKGDALDDTVGTWMLTTC